MTQPTDTELIKALRLAADRLNERSCLLNKILYHLAVATGRAVIGAESVVHSPDDIMDEALEMIGAHHRSNTIGWLRSDG